MKVFISWSGETSHKVAKALRDWLPGVIQSIVPYVSSEDIDKGSRWSSDIASELDESAFGILCVTPDNIDAPWLNFEAGALGKSVEKSRVCPFLFSIKRSDVKGPILQFQSTIHEKDDIFKLIKAINAASGEHELDEIRLGKTFDVWYPELDKSLSQIEVVGSAESKEPENESSNDYVSRVLEEVLEISRTNQKLLRDPATILPPDYFEHIMDRTTRSKRYMLDERMLGERFEPGAIEETVIQYREFLKRLTDFYKNNIGAKEELDELLHVLRRMDRPLRYLSKSVGMRIPKELFDDM